MTKTQTLAQAAPGDKLLSIEGIPAAQFVAGIAFTNESQVLVIKWIRTAGKGKNATIYGRFTNGGLLRPGLASTPCVIEGN